MKKRLFTCKNFNAGSLLIAGVLFLVFCFNVEAGGNKNKPATVLTVGATPVPHAEMLNLISDTLAAQGIILNVIEFNDYDGPNTALINGEIDANFSQNLPYLESHRDWVERLVPVFGVHIEPLGLYSTKYRNINRLPDGAMIAIPNDPINGGRALLLLQANGLITLRDGAGMTASLSDITGNPKNFRFREIEAALLVRALVDIDAAIINGNFALQAGLNPVRDSLIIEGPDSPYVNYVVVRKGSEHDSKILALRSALLSPAIRDYINRMDGLVSAF